MKDKISNLEKLQQIGIQQIIKDTFVDIDTINALLNKDYGFFKNKITLYRFLKMLESNYDLNFDLIKEEYKNFCEEENKNSSLEDTHHISFDKETKNYTFIIYIIIAIIVIYFISSIPSTEDDTRISNSENINLEIVKEINTSKLSVKYKVNKELTIIPLIKKRHNIQQNTQEDIESTLNPEIQDILDRDITIDLNQSILEIKNNVITITSTLERIWIGTIDLETYDKRSSIIDSKVFNLYDNMIIVTGHGHISLTSGNKDYTISSGGKQYFYYKDKQFVKLKEIEYLYLNKGIKW
jgi:hypothetical protein